MVLEGRVGASWGTGGIPSMRTRHSVPRCLFFLDWAVSNHFTLSVQERPLLPTSNRANGGEPPGHGPSGAGPATVVNGGEGSDDEQEGRTPGK